MNRPNRKERGGGKRRAAVQTSVGGDKKRWVLNVRGNMIANSTPIVHPITMDHDCMWFHTTPQPARYIIDLTKASYLEIGLTLLDPHPLSLRTFVSL